MTVQQVVVIDRFKSQRCGVSCRAHDTAASLGFPVEIGFPSREWVEGGSHDVPSSDTPTNGLETRHVTDDGRRIPRLQSWVLVTCTDKIITGTHHLFVWTQNHECTQLSLHRTLIT